MQPVAFGLGPADSVILLGQGADEMLMHSLPIHTGEPAFFKECVWHRFQIYQRGFKLHLLRFCFLRRFGRGGRC